MATGGFLLPPRDRDAERPLHEEHAGFQVAIPVGLLLSAVFAARLGVRRRRPDLADRGRSATATLLRRGVLIAMAGWFALDGRRPAAARRTGQRGRAQAACSRCSRSSGPSSTRSAPRATGSIFRHGRKLLPAAVVACFVLLAEAMIGVAVTGERDVARELVGVARPDRLRVPDRRLRRPARVAGRALPATSTCRRRASAGRTSASSSATSSASRASPSARRRPRSPQCSTRTGASRRR